MCGAASLVRLRRTENFLELLAILASCKAHKKALGPGGWLHAARGEERLLAEWVWLQTKRTTTRLNKSKGMVGVDSLICNECAKSVRRRAVN